MPAFQSLGREFHHLPIVCLQRMLGIIVAVMMKSIIHLKRAYKKGGVAVVYRQGEWANMLWYPAEQSWEPTLSPQPGGDSRGGYDIWKHGNAPWPADAPAPGTTTSHCPACSSRARYPDLKHCLLRPHSPACGADGQGSPGLQRCQTPWSSHLSVRVHSLLGTQMPVSLKMI